MSTATPHIDMAMADSLTACEWARRLNVSPSTVTRWALSGELEHVRIGKQIRVSPEAMETLLRNRTESRQRQHKPNAGAKAQSAAHSAEIDAELAEI